MPPPRRLPAGALATLLLLLTAGTRPANAATTFPLAVSKSGRHLVDARGKPFLYLADTAWELPVRLTRDEVDEYLELRRAQGFAALNIMLLPPAVEERTRDGEAAFAEPGALDRPNDRYFAHVEWIVRRAAEKGMAVGLISLWRGCCAQSVHYWDPYLTLENARGFGRYLGRRFKRHPNVVWIHGGDRDPGHKTEEIRALVSGIEEAGARQLHTYEGTPRGRYNAGSSSLAVHDEPWLDFNLVAFHTGVLYPQLHRDYTRAPTKPVLLSRSLFEASWMGVTPKRLRQQIYWTLLGGGAGLGYGHDRVYSFSAKRWRAAITEPGALAVGHARRLFEARRFDRLVPDVREELVVEGRGFYGSPDYALAAQDADRRFAVVYVPQPRRIKVDLSGLAGPVEASWFDPQDGRSRPAGTFPRGALAELTPPAEGEDRDWVLVLDAGRAPSGGRAALGR